MTRYPNHPIVEKREMLRIDGIIELKRCLYCSTQNGIILSIFSFSHSGVVTTGNR